MDPSDNISETDKKKLDLLMQQYSLLRSEVLLQISSIKNHTKYTQIAFAAMASLVSVMLSTNILGASYDIKYERGYLWLFIIFFISTIIYYLLYALFESVYTMHFLNAHMSSVEKKINKLVDESVLIWESEVASKIIALPVPVKGVLSPHMMMSFHPAVAIFLATVIFPIVVCYKLWFASPSGDTCFLALVLVTGGYCILSACLGAYTALGTYRRVRKGLPPLIDDAWKDSETSRAK
jgi:hypothetical protein